MKKNLSELTIDELKSREKSLKTAVGLLIGLMIGIVGSLIAILILKGSRSIVIPLSVIPLTFIPVLVSSKKNLKDIESEIALRNKR